MVIVGDVHGKVNKYLYHIVKKNKRTIQLGDFGFRKEHDWHLKNVDSKNHKIVFGNHDFYPYLDKPYSYGNYSLIDNHIFAIRGAKSIDQHLRKEGKDWFKDEEIEYGMWNIIIQKILDNKPEVILSHDCPSSVSQYFFGYNQNHPKNKSITNQALQSIFEFYQPNMWIFGHHHRSKNEKINGTRFICLEELETFSL